VSNVISDNLALKDQLRETIQDVNRLEDENTRSKNAILKLKAKIEQMKDRQNLATQALKD